MKRKKYTKEIYTNYSYLNEIVYINKATIKLGWDNLKLLIFNIQRLDLVRVKKTKLVSKCIKGYWWNWESEFCFRLNERNEHQNITFSKN